MTDSKIRTFCHLVKVVHFCWQNHSNQNVWLFLRRRNFSHTVGCVSRDSWGHLVVFCKHFLCKNILFCVPVSAGDWPSRRRSVSCSWCPSWCSSWLVILTCIVKSCAFFFKLWLTFSLLLFPQHYDSTDWEDVDLAAASRSLSWHPIAISGILLTRTNGDWYYGQWTWRERTWRSCCWRSCKCLFCFTYSKRVFFINKIVVL